MSKSKAEAIFILAVLSLIWGSSFILMKKGLLAFSAPQVASLRIIFAGLIFVPFIIKNFSSIPWQKFKIVIIFALLEIGIPPFLYTFAQQHVDSSSASILNSLVPLFTLIIGLMYFSHKFSWAASLGVLLGLIGAFVMTFLKASSNLNSVLDFGNSWGLLVVLATLFYGIAGNILKEYLNDLTSGMLSALAFVSMAIPAAIYLPTTGFFSLPLTSAHNLYSLGAIAILSTFGSALAILLFTKLIKFSTALMASFVTYLIPFVSLFWGWIDGEDISIIHFSSLIIIFLGIWLANRKSTV
ncbi:MAG: DMT family transporter [Candidatus Kapabacteria bacterium]|nr:DMT family transporter [Candidatus Kapabacteria bacterium]